MKRLKTISLFRICILYGICIYTGSYILILLSSIYLLLINKYDSLIFILLILCSLCINTKTDYIKYGIVNETKETYVIVNKGLYYVKSYDFDLKVGDIVFFEYESVINSDTNLLKKNYKFNNYKEANVIYHLPYRTYVLNYIDDFSDEVANTLKRIIYNDYSVDTDIEFLGYGLTFYYLLLIVKRKSKIGSFILMIFYIVFIRFDIKFYLIIIDYLLDIFKISKSINRISFKILIILFINRYLILNYSILISILFSILFVSNYKNKKYLILLIQSLFFNEIKVITGLFYSYYLYIKVFIYVFSFLILFIKPLSNCYLLIISSIDKLFGYINFSIRGRISFLSYILVTIIIYIFKINKDYIKYILYCLIIMSPINNPLLHINFIDVGQGDAILIHGSYNSFNILVDTGSSYNWNKLKNALYKEGIYKIDYLIVTHNDEDHCGNVDELEKYFNINEVITVGKDIENKEIKLSYLYLGEYDNDNDNSLVYLLEIDNYQVLLTGDISKNVENLIVNNLNIKDIDILKVAHHGSKYSTSSYFVGNLKPNYAIIQTNGAYNHPSQEVLDVLDGYLVDTCITKESGNIVFYFTNIVDFIKTSKNEFVII